MFLIEEAVGGKLYVMKAEMGCRVMFIMLLFGSRPRAPYQVGNSGAL